MDPKGNQLKPAPIHYVSSTDSTEFTLFSEALKHATVVALDAEWKPIRRSSSFPSVSLLQLACRLKPTDSNSLNEGREVDAQTNLVVFLVDLQEIDVKSIWGDLKEMFASDDVLKLGFRFKQDLIYLSSTFCSHGCDPGFDEVKPFIDISSVYRYLHEKQSGRKLSKDTKGLAAICEEVLGVSLAKELQCSDWSCRPLTEEQKAYAAADAKCLVEIFDFFQHKVLREGITVDGSSELHPLNVVLESKEVFKNSEDSARPFSSFLCLKDGALGPSISELVQMYGEKLMLKESDKIPKISKKRGKKEPPVCREKQVESCVSYQGPPPWDSSLGGDGCPKFLCDVMVEGLAKHLRCVGVDAACPPSRKPDPRMLTKQASKEKRILLTRDTKLLKQYEYVIPNQIYRVNSLLKNDQLIEVIQQFKLTVCKDQLMSRCTKCNGKFIQKPLTTEEAVEASKGFQIIPNCLFDRNIEFWQCMDCKQLYWEGTQYHNAVEKFIDICQLNKGQTKKTLQSL